MKFLDKIVGNIYLDYRLLRFAILIVFLFCLGFPYPIFIPIGKIGLSVIVLLTIVDIATLFGNKQLISGERIIESKLSNGDENPVILRIVGKANFTMNLDILEEFPEQLQLRDTRFELKGLKPAFERDIQYDVRPVERGIYRFGNTQVFVRSTLSLVKRRVTLVTEQEVKVYPSFIQARKYSFLAINNRIEEIGVKKIRRLGVSHEFEQIRDYVTGDDFRLVNWKASARRGDLMVNQFQEERAQNIYCLVDKGRMMHMPFDGLSLIDYAINSSLVMAGIAIGRGDKAGLITFSDKIGSFMIANRKPMQMSMIADALYAQETRLRESDYFRLYKNIKFKIRKRSLLILFTNFDSLVSLERQVKYLRAIARDHLLCTVIFDNTEINERADSQTFGLKSAYDQTIAEKFQFDKRQIIRELNKNGIYTILTEPQHLTVNTINKYIELKAKGAI
ncbi:MAG: DUF58 domain-containing protein [Cyclobacteriaceae bacterium]